ncbi:kinase-like domain-containing protein, partial [Spinellus fusiger]
RKKTTISRKPVTSSLPISPLERRSPAASFLSTFSAPAQIVQEEKGDEIDDYVLDNVIGFGGFSTVRKGYRISDGQKVAIKIIKKSVPEDEEDQILLEREIAIWKSLDHPHIVNVHSVLETDRATYIVADYCAKGHLLDLVAHQGLSEAKAKALFVPLAQAIHYLHSQARVCHKDIKLENVLVDENNIVKLCDFGLAIPCQPTKTTQPAGGSLAYVAPEQILSSTAMGCPKTDVWSLGIVLYTLVTGKLPFAESQTARLQHIILSGQWDMPASLSQELQSLLRSCICIDPEQRFDTQQILASPW